METLLPVRKWLEFGKGCQKGTWLGRDADLLAAYCTEQVEELVDNSCQGLVGSSLEIVESSRYLDIQLSKT